MFTSYRLTSIEYYLSDVDVDAAEQKAGARDRAAYYVDNGTELGETTAKWWAPAGNVILDKQITRLVERGTVVSPRAFRALAAGCDPRTGEVKVTSNRTDRAQRTVGYDCQMSAPKSVSSLWACADVTGDTKTANAILDTQMEAMFVAMDWAQSHGLNVVRRGSGSGGTSRLVPVVDIAAAAFLHTTSRSGDPQVHGHFVITSLAVGPDGRVSGIDNAELIKYQGAMGAVYRAALADGLQKRLGVAIEQKERGFEVLGVPEGLTAQWSKRRQAIEAMAEAEGFHTSKDRERAQIAALATRDAKEKVPVEELKQRWREEAVAVGYSPENVLLMANAAGRKQRNERIEQGRAAEDSRAITEMSPAEQAEAIARANEIARGAAAEAALAHLMSTQAVVEQRHLYKEIGERLVGLGDSETIEAAVEKLIADGKMVRLDAEPGSIAGTESTREVVEPWMQQTGGLEALSPELREAAEKSYADWLAAKPQFSNVDIGDYVQYTQDRDKERVAREEAKGAKELFEGRLEPVYSTPEMIRLEKSMIANSVNRKNEGRLVPVEAVEAAIAKRRGILVGDVQAQTVLETLTKDSISFEAARIEEAIKAARLDDKQSAALRKMAVDFLAKSDGEPPANIDVVKDAMAPLKGMSDEQADFVRHLLGPDGVALGSAPPGSGKSFVLGCAVDACEMSGVQTWVIAPSWKATSVAREDSGVREEFAKAVSGFCNRIDDPAHKERIELGRSIVFIDEFGMVPTAEMEIIARQAAASGAHICGVGDTKQLSPVGAGSAMVVLERNLDSAKMTEIRRQKVAWMRSASTSLHKGGKEIVSALETYDRAGLIEWTDGRKATLDALVKDWREDLLARPDADMSKGRIAMAYTNSDLRLLNAAMRDEFRDMGRLTGPDFEMKAFRRGDGKLDTLAIAAGDRLIFGERLKVGGVSISGGSVMKNGVLTDNSDCGTVESVSGNSADPTVKVRLDKGKVVTAKWSEFVGWRPDDAKPEDRHPKVVHSYAVSIHAAQGQTVDKAFLLNTVGLKSESLLVGLTRHKEWAKMYVDTSPVYDRLESKFAERSIVTQKGKKGIGAADAPEGGEEDPFDRSGKITIEDVKQHVFKASCQSEAKKNISDYVDSPARWAKGEKLASWEEQPLAATNSVSPQNLGALALKKPLEAKSVTEQAVTAARESALALHDNHPALPTDMPRGIVGTEADYKAAVEAFDAVRQRQDAERSKATKAGLMRPFGQRWVPPRKPKEEKDVRTNSGRPGDLAAAVVGKPDGKPVVDHVRNHAACGTELAVASYAGAPAGGPPPAARGVMRGLSAIPVVGHRAGRGEVLLRQDVRVRVDDVGTERDPAVRRPDHLGTSGSGQTQEDRREAAQGGVRRQGEIPVDGGKGTPEGSQGIRKAGGQGGEGSRESGEGGVTPMRPSPFAYRPFGRPLVPAAATAADHGNREKDVPAKKSEEPKIIRPAAFRAPHIRPPQQTAQDIKDRMEDRLQGTKYPLPDRVPEKVRVPEKQQWQRQTKEEAKAELDHFGQAVDLRALAAKHSWRDMPDWRQKEVGADRKKAWVMEKGGVEIVVTSKGEWCPVGGGKGEGGGCISFLQEAEGWGRGSLGRVRQELRAFLGEDPRQQQPRVQAIQSDLQRVVDKTPKEKDYTGVRTAWQRLEQKTEYEYLTKRGITPETQRAFAADLRQGVDGYGHPFVAVPHRNDRGEIVGFEKKGPKAHPLDERSMSMLEKGSDRGLTRMGQRENPTKIIVAEGFVDALSKWQMDGSPKGACLCSLSGGPTDRSRRELAAFVAKNPNAEVTICTDNDNEKYKVDYKNKTVVREDPPGDRFATDIRRAIRFETPNANIVISKASEQFKDTNDELRGVTKIDVERSYQEALRRCSSPDASVADQEKAQARLDKDNEAHTAYMLWNALDSGRASPGQVREAVEAMGAAKHDRSDRAKAAADAKAREEEAQRLAAEEAQRAQATKVTRGGFHI